jgi:hypothetical protein
MKNGVVAHLRADCALMGGSDCRKRRFARAFILTPGNRVRVPPFPVPLSSRLAHGAGANGTGPQANALPRLCITKRAAGWREEAVAEVVLPAYPRPDYRAPSAA